MKVFESIDYRHYIHYQMQANGGVRGYQKRLANASNCQSSFISQVLNAHVQLTPDQAAGMAKFWRLEDDEVEFFIGLVNLSRAATPYLQNTIKARLEELKHKNQDMAQRFKKKQRLSLEDELLYYSAWHYSAIHMMTTIPDFGTSLTISKKLNLSQGLVETVLNSLLGIGLVKQNKGIWQATDLNIHLPKKSKLSLFNHSNWRQYIALKLQDSNHENLHYTAVHSMAKKDFEKFKTIILECIETTRKLVDPSVEEEVVCFVCDFIKVN